MVPASTVHRWAARLLAVGLATAWLGLVVGPAVGPTAATADPIGDKQAEAAALAHQIDAQGRLVQILANQFDGAMLHADQVQQQLAAARVELARAQALAGHDRAVLASEAVQAYTHGGYLAPPGPSSYRGGDGLAVAQGYFHLATSNQADALERLRSSQHALRARQQSLQVDTRDAQVALATLATRRAAVEKAAAASQATLTRVRGDLVLLVAQQQAEMAARQQAQVQAQLAAEPARRRLSAPAPVRLAAAPTVPGVSAPPPRTGPPTVRPAPGPPSPPLPQPGPAPQPDPQPQPQTQTPPHPPPGPSSGAAAALSYARAQLGKPYLWGASGPDAFDCSGLTMMAWSAAGVSLPHYTVAQYDATAHVPISALQPGDLVFFGSDFHHMGLYVGGGEMIDAPYTGTVVRYDSIYAPDLQPFAGRPG